MRRLWLFMLRLTVCASLGMPFIVSCGRQAAASPSFDCGKASTPIEKIICSNEGLSALDTFVASDYTKKRHSLDADAARTLVEEQRHWLTNRLSECHVPSPGEDLTQEQESAVVSCLTGLYSKRLVDLRDPEEHAYWRDLKKRHQVLLGKKRVDEVAWFNAIHQLDADKSGENEEKISDDAKKIDEYKKIIDDDNDKLNKIEDELYHKDIYKNIGDSGEGK